MNSISFNKERYESYDEMMLDVAKIMGLLVKNRYEVAFYHDDCDVYVLEFDYDKNLGYGNEGLYWVKPDEMEMLWELKSQEEDDVHD